MPRRCVECRGRELVATEAEEQIEVAGKVFAATLPAIKCVKCGAAHLGHDALGELELAGAGKLARRGEVTPESFGFMRRTIGVRAFELAEWLDVSPETVSRWEHGRQPIDRGAATILSALVEDLHQGVVRSQEVPEPIRSVLSAPQDAPAGEEA